MPFGNYIIEANDPSSELRNKEIDYLFFIESLDDMIVFDSVLSESQMEHITDQWDTYLDNINSLRKKINGAIFIIHRELIRKKKTYDNRKHGFYLMPKYRSIDINQLIFSLGPKVRIFHQKNLLSLQNSINL